MLRHANEEDDEEEEEDAEEAKEDEEGVDGGGYLRSSGVWRFFTSFTAALSSAAHRTASRRSMGLSACIDAVVAFLADGVITCLTAPPSLCCPPEQKLATEYVVAGELFVVTVRNFGLLGPLSC